MSLSPSTSIPSGWQPSQPVKYISNRNISNAFSPRSPPPCQVWDEVRDGNTETSNGGEGTQRNMRLVAATRMSMVDEFISLRNRAVGMRRGGRNDERRALSFPRDTRSLARHDRS